MTQLGGLLKMVPSGLIRGAAQKVIEDVWDGIAKKLVPPPDEQIPGGGGYGPWPSFQVFNTTLTPVPLLNARPAGWCS